MKSLWAPWRIDYIRGDKENGCVFCSKTGKEEDKENLILYKGERNFIIMNRYPYSNGHLMVVPYRHTNALSDLDHEERLEMMNLTILCMDVLKVMNPQGFNVGMNLGSVAGAGIDDHLHFHVVPRWQGDTNFMPVIGDVRVMPEYLEDTYNTLNQELNKLRGDQ